MTCFLVQILILALMCIAHGLESAGPIVRMTLVVSAIHVFLFISTGVPCPGVYLLDHLPCPSCQGKV